MAIPKVAKDFAYQGTQLLIFAPVSALLAKTETASRFIPRFETLLNANAWKGKLTELWKGPTLQEGVQAPAFDFNPLSEANRETVMIATTIALVTTTIFQGLRHVPGFKNSPKTAFAVSAAISAGTLFAASEFNVIPVNASTVSEVFKNILVVGGSITSTAKVLNLGREWIGPVLNFADLLSPVKSDSGSTGAGSRRDEQVDRRDQSLESSIREDFLPFNEEHDTSSSPIRREDSPPPPPPKKEHHTSSSSIRPEDTPPPRDSQSGGSSSGSKFVSPSKLRQDHTEDQKSTTPRSPPPSPPPSPEQKIRSTPPVNTGGSSASDVSTTTIGSDTGAVDDTYGY